MKKINTIKHSIKKYILIHSQQIDNPYNYNNIVHQNLPVTICCVQIIIGIFVLISVS